MEVGLEVTVKEDEEEGGTEDIDTERSKDAIEFEEESTTFWEEEEEEVDFFFVRTKYWRRRREATARSSLRPMGARVEARMLISSPPFWEEEEEDFLTFL